MNQPEFHPIGDTAAMEKHIVAVHKFSIKDGIWNPDHRVYAKTIGDITVEYVAEKRHDGRWWIMVQRVESQDQPTQYVPMDAKFHQYGRQLHPYDPSPVPMPYGAYGSQMIQKFKSVLKDPSGSLDRLFREHRISRSPVMLTGDIATKTMYFFFERDGNDYNLELFLVDSGTVSLLAGKKVSASMTIQVEEFPSRKN